MKTLSIISHFYNHHPRVDEQIAHWGSLPEEIKKDIEIILVDDHSDVEYELPISDLDIKLFRVTDDIPWNQGGARNLGVYNASGEIILITDIDQFVYGDFISLLVQQSALVGKETLNFFRIKSLINIQNNKPLDHHPNSFFVRLADFKKLGMYDEDFVGYYGYEDIYMVKVWQKNGGKIAFVDRVVSENKDFGTTNLNRNIERNYHLIVEKMNEINFTRSPSILRFNWIQKNR
jgi:glycosyltransferase involved in cell wall biosynthesis